MKFITTAILLFSLLSYGQSNRAAMKLLNTAKPAVSNFYYETEFDPSFGEVLFPVQVNGATLMFSIDTGAPNFIPKSVKDEGNFDVTGTLETGSGNLDIVTADSFSIGPVQFDGVSMLVEDVSGSPAMLCSGGSLLGTGVLNEAVWHIDLRERKLVITDDIKKIDLSRAERQKVNLNKYGQPLVTVKINGKPVEMLFDLGHGYPIELDVETAKNLTPQNLKMVYGARTENWKGVAIYTNLVFNGSTVSLGKSMVRDVPVFISKHVSIPAMGFPMLENYKVTLNMGKREIYFEPYAQQPEPWQTFGYFPVYEGGKLRIASIYEGSAADRAGLRPGDEILELNGEPVDCADYCSCRKLFMNYPRSEKEQEVTVQQGIGTKKVKLVKLAIHK